MSTATAKQISFLGDLLTRKETSHLQNPPTEEDIYFLSAREASEWIDALLKSPPKGGFAPSRDAEFLPLVPAGRYAITGEDGTTDFYKVDHGKGNWEGRIFVSLLLGSPGGFRDERIGAKARWTVLDTIVTDGPEECARRFGRELGICAMCGSPLTNPESIALGIGPECRKKF